MPYLHVLILECLKLFYDEMIYLFIYLFFGYTVSMTCFTKHDSQ